MITLYENFSIQAQALPYTYQFSSSVPDCITFDNASGFSSSSTLSTAIIGNSACIDGATINLLIVDKNGCRETISYTLSSPCNNFTMTDIVRNNFTFTVNTIVPHCQGSTINWGYDTNLFTEVQVSTTPTSSTIILEPLPDATITDSIITATAVDCIGCIIQKNTSVTVCRDQVALEPPSQILCGSTSATIVFGFLTSCSTSVDAWLTTNNGTLEIIPSAGISANLLQALNAAPQGGVYRLRTLVRFDAPVEAGQTFTIQFRIKSNPNSFGWSPWLTKVITVGGDCIDDSDVNRQGLSLPDITAEVLSTTLSTGDIIDIPLPANVFDNLLGQRPDYSSFYLNPEPATAASNVELVRTMDGNFAIRYEIDDPTIPIDVVSWGIFTEDGLSYSSSNILLTRQITGAQATNVTGCASVGTTATINTNFVSSRPMNVASIKVMNSNLAPADVRVEGFGIKYTPFETQEALGVKTLMYSGKDVDNRAANSATVTVTVISAGIGSTNNLCTPYTLTPSTVTPYNYITGPKNTNGTWTKTSETGPTAPATATGSINLSTYGAGTYSYRYSVTNGTCTDTATVNFVVTAHVPVANDTCATAQSFSFGGAGRVSSLELLTNKATCPGIRKPTMSVIAVPSVWSLGTYDGDLWYEFTAPYQEFGLSYPITVTVSGNSYGQEAGIKAPALAIYRGDCPGFTLEKAVATNELTQTASATISFGTLNTNQKFFIRVSSIAGYEGLYNLRVSGVVDYVTSNLNNLNTPIV
jgi:hypothetical protein